jgi:hypothetical protein
LGCIYPLQFRIDIFDSLSKLDLTRSKHYGLALLYMMEDRTKSLRLPFDMNKWIIVDKCCPQQTNTWDCGVSVCLIALFKSRGLALNYNGLFMEERREEIKYSILSKEIRITTNVLSMQEKSSTPNPSSGDISINDLSTVGIPFTIVSRFDGAVHKSSLDVNMEEQELDDKVKPDNDNESTQSTLLEEVGPRIKTDYDDESTLSEEVGLPDRLTLSEEVGLPDQLAHRQLEKQDNFIKRLIKEDTNLSHEEATNVLADADGIILDALRNVRKRQTSTTVASKNNDKRAGAQAEKSPMVAKVSNKPSLPPPPAAKASTKSKSPPLLHVAKARSFVRSKTKSSTQMQRHVRSVKSGKVNKLPLAADDGDRSSTSDSEDGSVGYLSEGDVEKLHKNRMILTELSCGDSIHYDDVKFTAGKPGTRCESTIVKINKIERVVILKNGYILQVGQMVWSKLFMHGKMFEKLLLNEGGTATAGTFYMNQGIELAEVVDECVDKMEYLVGTSNDELNSLVNGKSSPRRSGRSPRPNRMYGPESGFVGSTQTETHRTNKRKKVSTTATRPVADALPTDASPAADALVTKRRRIPNPKYYKK